MRFLIRPKGPSAPGREEQMSCRPHRPGTGPAACRFPLPCARPPPAPRYSISMVPGGFDVTSYSTRFTPFTSLMMRVAVSARKSWLNG